MGTIWGGGVQGWRTGLKSRGRPFDSDPSHHIRIEKGEIKMYFEILALENRISNLRGRAGKENGKIVRKLERRLRRLHNSV